MTFRIQRVAAEGFRGYGERVEFDCAGDVVVLVGPNGWGKTSFFDALTWCFFGRIPRLLGSRDAVGADLIRNRFSFDTPPTVSVVLQDDTEVVVVARDESGLRVVTDEGDLSSSEATAWIKTLFVGAGPFPQEPGEGEIQDDPETAFLRCHLLSQDQMVRFLRETNPRDRFDALASLLGLDVVRSFYGHMGEVRKDMNERVEERRRRERQIEQNLASLRAEVEETAGLDDGTSPTLEGLLTTYSSLREEAAGLGIDTATVDQPVDATDLAVRARDMSVQAAALADDADARASELIVLREALGAAAERNLATRELIERRKNIEPTVADLRRSAAELRGRMHRISQEIAAIDARLREEDDRRAALSSFLRLALDRLDEEHCPLCGQSIVLEDVRRRVAQGLEAVPESVSSLQQDKESAKTSLRGVEEAMETTRLRLEEEEQGLEELDREIGDASTASAALSRRLQALGLELRAERVDLTREHESATTHAEKRRSLESRTSVLSRRAAFVAAAERLANLHRQVERLEVDFERARGEAHLAVASLTAADEVITASRRSERDLVRQMFENIAPTMDALYGRLRPHPVLDRLRLDVGSFDERGEVRFVAYSSTADANVTNIFSSAQLNAVAVCIFLAMNLAVVRSKAAFALLDDPIQNMDDFNVLGLLDLLRGLLGDRQFILSTHDDQIGDLLRRKLRPVESGDQTIVHRFTAYGSAGPIVDTLTDSYMESTRVLEAASPV